jgi:glucosamine--fructose-6-phosphate aminotransferase (isomerizing)
LSSSTEHGRGDEGSNHKPGGYSLAEIFSQPDCWDACLADLRRNDVLNEVRDRFGEATEWLFIGCGSSYYVALCAAATMTAWAGLRARAVPASEVLLYPDLAVPTSGTCVPVLISRSGQTSEVLKAAEFFKARSIPTLAISCAEAQALEKLASLTITLPGADEKSTVMTRSFTSMLIALQGLAALLGGKSAEGDALRRIPGIVKPVLRTFPDKIRDFVADHQFADYVCLGQGPFYGLACEYALKVTEMSTSYAQAFHTLEFRHGPKSIVGPETLLIFLLSEKGYAAECDVLEEMKSLGGTTMVVANRASERVAPAADIVFELGGDGPELARLAPSLVPGQLLGLYSGLKKGLDPDSPRNLSRAVILNDSSSKKPEHAAF